MNIHKPPIQEDAGGGELFKRAEAGINELPIDKTTRRVALRNLKRWLTDSQFAAYWPQLGWMIENQSWSLLLDGFYQVLPFGTGGRRGPVGIGTNRFNPWTLSSSVQGHCDYLTERVRDDGLSVVIAYDVREFQDIRRIHNADLPNPVDGMTSRDFARVAASVYAANGITVHMSSDDSPHYVSTPELSFAIRRLHASAGLNVSASHNHPDDNGGKFYNADGGQEIPPNDQSMVDQVENVDHVATMDFESAKEKGLIHWLAPEIHDEYIALNLSQSLQPTARNTKIVFTPLHGTGDTTAGEVLLKAGFEVLLVEEQATHDGGFPGVPYRAPNPEVPESMQRGIDLAREVDADLVMACDPDADRIGVVSRNADGSYHFLAGNEIAVLVVHYKLRKLRDLGKLPENPLVVKTEVTTSLIEPITESFGGRLIGNLLVGYKYIANVLHHLELDGSWQGSPGSLSDFVCGAEESHGILVTPEIRDKDAAGAAILLAELASELRASELTLVDYLDDIYSVHGYYANLLTSMVMTGAKGMADIRAIQDGLRREPITTVAGLRVVEMRDHWDETGPLGPFVSETDRVSRNVIIFLLEDGSRLIARPSGTEPKIKAYVEVPSRAIGEKAGPAVVGNLADLKAQSDLKAEEIAISFSRTMLEIIGVRLPDYALRISGLVPLDKRIEWVEKFLPGFEKKVESSVAGECTESNVSEWIDEQLITYGKDARGLVSDALLSYLGEEMSRVSLLNENDAQRRRDTLNSMRAIFIA